MAIAVRFAFLPLFLLVFALLALLKFLCLLFLPAVHLVHLLLLAALELILALAICVLAAQSLLFLVVSPLHFLTLRVLLPLHFVVVSFMFLLQSGIGGRVVGMARRGRAIEVTTISFAAFVWAIGFPRVGSVSVGASATVVNFGTIITASAVIRSAVLDVTAAEFAGAWSRGDVGAAMIDGSPEATITASSFKVMVLL